MPGGFLLLRYKGVLVRFLIHKYDMVVSLSILMILLCLFLPKFAFSDVNEWSLLGLADQPVRTLCILRENPNIMIAGAIHYYMEPNTGGIFRSINSGASWDSVALRGVGVWQVIEAPESPTLYAATSDGFYRSYDHGVTWNLVTRYGLIPWAQGASIAVDPLDSLHLILGTAGPEGGLLAGSHDYGSSCNTLLGGVGFVGIFYHPIAPHRWYAWGGSPCYQSVDSGNTWDLWCYRYHGIHAFSISSFSNRIWICSDSLLWTDNFGESWSGTVASTPGYLVSVLQGILNDSDIVVGTTGGAYLIQDPYGEWDFLNNGAPNEQCLLFNHFNNPACLFAGFPEGLWSYTIAQTVIQSNNISISPSLSIYPNPFNSTTIIRYGLPEAGNVKIQVYDVLGRKVTTLINEPQTAGWHQVQWNAKSTHGIDVSSGIYFYRIEVGGYSQTKKMLLLK
jgi:hypothetical protein